MRKILFRGKRVDNNEWVYGYYLRAEYEEKTFIVVFDGIESGETLFDSIEVDPKTIGQFTGFFDKKENMIFEGDLLHTPGYYCEVRFIDGMFCSVYNHPEDGETLPLVDLSPERFEIIGNIYEN